MNLPKSLRIGDLIAKVPIVQGGMGVGISLSGLAIAVADQGGIGVIATPGVGLKEADFGLGMAHLKADLRALRQEIRKARERTSGIIAVNIMVALTDFGKIATIAIEEGIDIIFSGAGLPMELPKYLTDMSKTKLVPIVSSAKAAYIMAKRWMKRFNYVPDAFVVEGPKAGGHLGFKEEQINDPEFSLEKILPEVVKVAHEVSETSGKEIPVIAAGGIFTGSDMYDMMELGADGVQLGTRFVATKECDAPESFKQTYVNCKKEDLVIINSPVGLPGRVIKNHFVEDVRAKIRHPFKCGYHCIITCDPKTSPYCIADALINAQLDKRIEKGFVFAGANAYRINEITTVKDVFDDLLSGYSKRAEEDLK